MCADKVRLDGGQIVRLTISVGGVVLEAGEAFEAGIAKADLALYATKLAGRNDVAIYDPVRHGKPGEALRKLA
jgi:GGDEF domain-containing protein